MKNKLVLLCFVLACLIFGVNNALATPHSTMEQEIANSIACNDLSKALTLLNTVIAENQEDIFALGIRSQVLLQMGDVSKALDDIDAILDKDITTEGMLLYRCVIKESQTENLSDAILCYATAAQTLEQTCSQNELIHSSDYVKLLILANAPNAEEIRKKHMEYLQTDATREYDLLYIKSFDRSKIKPLIDAIQSAQNNNRKR